MEQQTQISTKKVIDTLEDFREENGLNKQEIAILLGVSRQTYSAWTLGQYAKDYMPISKVEHYFNKLHIPFNRIFETKEYEKNRKIVDALPDYLIEYLATSHGQATLARGYLAWLEVAGADEAVRRLNVDMREVRRVTDELYKKSVRDYDEFLRHREIPEYEKVAEEYYGGLRKSKTVDYKYSYDD